MARDPKHDVLFEPIKIGPKTLRNRFWQTSHCAGPGAERPGAQAHFRGMKAEGGWGAVFTEFCSIHPESDEYPYISARLWDQGDVLNLGYMCEVAHKYESLAGVQLWYSGGNAPSLESREFGRAPSQWLSPIFATRSVYGCEMDELDIRTVINMYVEAGKRAESAGFDLLEVSAGDDTLPMQFLAPRFEIDTLHGSEGVEAREDGVRMLELFRKEGVVDAVALKIGDYAEWGEDAGVSRFRKSGWMTPFIKQGKSILGPDIPVVGNGRLTSPDDMVALIRAGVLDIIGAARPSIADPFLPTKISEGRVEDIRECIGCNICVSKFQQGGQIMCTQNVTIGEEYRCGWHPEKFAKTTQPCSVLVVFANFSGCQCARILGERGYVVHLREADEELGGHWKAVATLPRLNEWGRVITYRQIQLAKLKKSVQVHLGVGNMTADEVLRYGADRVVIATGSDWSGDGRGANFGPIPGADHSLPHVLTPFQVTAGKPVPGKRVLVLDGDGHFMGVTLAEHMANQGKDVTYVCDAADVAEYGVFTMESFNNKRMLFEKGVKVYTSHWVDRIEPGTVSLSYLYKYGPDLTEPRSDAIPRKDNGGEFDLGVDAVILVTSRRSNDGLWRELKARKTEWGSNEIQDIFRTGDCKAPSQLNQALWDAHRLAREFDSPHPAYPLPWIRERQLWGGPTVPKLGDPRVDVEAG